MRAFLLAAGVGSRLREVTDNPKSLLKVNGISIIRNTINILQKNNIDISLAVGYKEDLIRKELNDIKNIEIISNIEYSKTNSIFSLHKFKDRLVDESIIINADVFWKEDLLKLILNEKTKTAIMIGDNSEERLINGDYFLQVNNDVIIDYGKELPIFKRDYEYVGIAKISQKFIKVFREKLIELINQEKYNLWWEDVLYELSNEHEIKVVNCNGIFWGEVDTEKDYNRILLHEKNIIKKEKI